MKKHARVYSPKDLALFAKYVAARADRRPAGCNGSADCWVEKGPPAMNSCGKRCLGCGFSLMDGKRDGKSGGKAATRYAR